MQRRGTTVLPQADVRGRLTKAPSCGALPTMAPLTVPTSLGQAAFGAACPQLSSGHVLASSVRCWPGRDPPQNTPQVSDGQNREQLAANWINHPAAISASPPHPAPACPRLARLSERSPVQVSHWCLQRQLRSHPLSPHRRTCLAPTRNRIP